MAKRKASFSSSSDKKENSNLSGLRQLIFLGRREIVINIDNVSFKLATLTSGQQRNMMREVMQLSDEERVASMREAIISRAIVSVNNVPLESFYEEEDSGDISDIQKKISLVSNMQFSVVEKLFVEYNKMIQEVEGVGDDDLKK